MADPEPFRVICLVPASVCWRIRAARQQPVGDCDRRPIGENVRKNIKARAHRCHQQGIISKDNLAYLLGWVESSLPRIPRPASYQFLNLCRHDLRLEPDFALPGPHTWRAPRRFRVITVLREGEDDDEGSDREMAGEVALAD